MCVCVTCVYVCVCVCVRQVLKYGFKQHYHVHYDYFDPKVLQTQASAYASTHKRVVQRQACADVL